jgi:hypothetical protein
MSSSFYIDGPNRTPRSLCLTLHKQQPPISLLLSCNTSVFLSLLLSSGNAALCYAHLSQTKSFIPWQLLVIYLCNKPNAYGICAFMWHPYYVSFLFIVQLYMSLLCTLDTSRVKSNRYTPFMYVTILWILTFETLTDIYRSLTAPRVSGNLYINCDLCLSLLSAVINDRNSVSLMIFFARFRDPLVTAVSQLYFSASIYIIYRI